MDRDSFTRLPDVSFSVHAHAWDGVPLMMRRRIGEAAPNDGRKEDRKAVIFTTLQGHPVIEVRRAGARPFTIAIPWESIVRFALDAEEAHRAALAMLDAAAPTTSTPEAP